MAICDVKNMEKVVFLDRDGTINIEKNYLYKKEDFEFVEGSDQAIKLLNDAGYKVFVVSNQAGVARGYYNEQDVETLHEYMNERLAEIGAHIDAFYYCPHHPEYGIGKYKIDCDCRKPKTGLLQKAEEIVTIDKTKSYMIGDNKGDILAGQNYGVKTILVKTGYGKKVIEEKSVEASYIAANLLEAVQFIIEKDTREDKMNTKIKNYLDELIVRYPILEKEKENIQKTFEILEQCYETKHKLLVAGNGGSAADAEHIVGELMKGFVLKRQPSDEFCNKLKAVDEEMGSVLGSKLQGGLPAIALNNHQSLNTAFLNDVDGDLYYAQQVYGYGEEGDVLLGISTSGNAKNIAHAAVVAKAKGMKVIGLSGKNGGKLKQYTDCIIIPDEKETYKIQELHLPIYHTLCLMLEERFFGENMQK